MILRPALDWCKPIRTTFNIKLKSKDELLQWYLLNSSYELREQELLYENRKT
jgi:hypothetical protein